MSAALGFILIFVIIALLMSKKVSVHLALTIPPIIAALILGSSVTDIGDYISAGITTNASTAIMLAFAVLFFSILYDAGMFDPIIKGVIRLAGGDPVKIAFATVVVAIISHLDGSGATTFLITCSSFLPVYRAIGMRISVLAMCTGLTAGVMNLLPWGGPTLRASVSLSMDVTELFMPMIPWMIGGLITIFIMAFILGMRERRRIGIRKDVVNSIGSTATAEEEALKRPNRTVINLIFCVLAIVVILTTWLPALVTFVVGVPIVLLINYPNPKEAQQRIMAACPTAFYTASIILAAGVMTGILTNTGMIEQMALSIARVFPTGLGAFVTPVIAFFSPILYIFIDADSFYYGLLPVLSAAFEVVGIAPANVAHAMLVGQIIFACQPVTASSWLLCSYCGIDMSDMQKLILPMGLVIAVVCILIGLPLGII